MSRRIGVDDARAFWAHPSQQIMGDRPEDLPDGDQFHYWTEGGVCLLFHPAFYSGHWMVHCGVKPEFWGSLVAPARTILGDFWADMEPQSVIACITRDNRPMRAFSRRVGFREVCNIGDISLSEWRPEWVA